MVSMLPRSRLGIAAGAWAGALFFVHIAPGIHHKSILSFLVGAGVATLVYRACKRALNARREAAVAAAGGRIPEARNVVEALRHRALRTPAAVALVGADGATYSWSAYDSESRRFGRALASIGASGGVAIHAFNEPRWFFAAVGALAAGWTVSGIYSTNTYDQSRHILSTSEVKVLVVETRSSRVDVRVRPRRLRS